MATKSNSRGMIGKDKTTVQAVITKDERRSIQQIANSQDRSESYIVAQAVREYLQKLTPVTSK